MYTRNRQLKNDQVPVRHIEIRTMKLGNSHLGGGFQCFDFNGDSSRSGQDSGQIVP